MQSPLRAGTLVLRGPSRCSWSRTFAQLRGAYCRKSLTFVAPESSLLCSHRRLWHQRAFCFAVTDVCVTRGHFATRHRRFWHKREFCSQMFVAEEGILQSSIQADVLQSLTFVAQEGIFYSPIFMAQEGIL